MATVAEEAREAPSVAGVGGKGIDSGSGILNVCGGPIKGIASAVLDFCSFVSGMTPAEPFVAAEDPESLAIEVGATEAEAEAVMPEAR